MAVDEPRCRVVQLVECAAATRRRLVPCGEGHRLAAQYQPTHAPPQLLQLRRTLCDELHPTAQGTRHLHLCQLHDDAPHARALRAQLLPRSPRAQYRQAEELACDVHLNVARTLDGLPLALDPPSPHLQRRRELQRTERAPRHGEDHPRAEHRVRDAPPRGERERHALPEDHHPIRALPLAHVVVVLRRELDGIKDHSAEARRHVRIGHGHERGRARPPQPCKRQVRTPPAEEAEHRVACRRGHAHRRLRRCETEGGRRGHCAHVDLKWAPREVQIREAHAEPVSA